MFFSSQLILWCYFQPCFSCTTFSLCSIFYTCHLISFSSLFFFHLLHLHFACAFLSLTIFTPKPPFRDKFVEVDLKPVCKHCYERLPEDMKHRLARRDRDSKDKKKKLLIPMCLWSCLSPFFSPAVFPLRSVSFLLFLPSILLIFTSAKFAQ